MTLEGNRRLRRLTHRKRAAKVTGSAPLDGLFPSGVSAKKQKRKKRYLKVMRAFFLIILSVAVAMCSVQGQTLLTETTWGGAGSDVAEGVASAADGSSYVAGITDSFTTDQFGNPSPRIFVVKFAPDG